MEYTIELFYSSDAVKGNADHRILSIVCSGLQMIWKIIEVTISQVASKLQRTNIKRMISPLNSTILKLNDEVGQI